MGRLIKLLRKYYIKGYLNKEQVIQLICDIQTPSKEIFINHVLSYCIFYGLPYDPATNLIKEISGVYITDMAKVEYFNWGSLIEVFINDDKFYTIKF